MHTRRHVIATGLLLLLAAPIVDGSPRGADARTPVAITRDLSKDHGGVSGDTINSAIDDARAYLRKNPDDTYIIAIPAGTFKVMETISVAKIGTPASKGKLIVQGAGKDATILVTNPERVGIRGKDTFHVAFVGMHFTLPIYTVTQGRVVSAKRGQVVIDIAKGFPDPVTIMSDKWLECHNKNQGQAATDCGPMRRYMRKYGGNQNDPQIVEKDNPQVSWSLAAPVPGVEGRWVFTVNENVELHYAPGDLIGIKSKEAENAYFFCGGSDFEFRDIRWTQRSRGVFRCGFDHIRLSGVEVLRASAIDGQVPALSSPAGGPQIGQPGEPTGNNLVENSVFVGTGDDAIGLFENDGTTIVRNNRIYDSFGRGIFLDASPNVKLENNTLIRNQALHQ